MIDPNVGIKASCRIKWQKDVLGLSSIQTSQISISLVKYVPNKCSCQYSKKEKQLGDFVVTHVVVKCLIENQ